MPVILRHLLAFSLQRSPITTLLSALLSFLSPASPPVSLLSFFSVPLLLGTDFSLFVLPQPISYDVFKLFMRAYLEVDLPQPLSTHLFLAFSQKPRQETPDHPTEGASNEASGPGTQTNIPQDGREMLHL